jgi:hypothetical protein
MMVLIRSAILVNNVDEHEWVDHRMALTNSEETIPPDNNP